jgi:tol-pal system protein YbgF
MRGLVGIRALAATGPLYAALLLCGCTDFGGGPIGGGGGDDAGAHPVSAQEARMQGIETKLGDLTRKLDNLNLAAQNQGVAQLQAEVRDLRGDVERLHFDLDTATKRNRELYADLDKRLAKLENEGRAKLSMAPTIANAPPVPASQEEESTYLAVFEQLRGGHYDEAITGFKDLTTRWPQGRYADNAWYWLGESYYAKKDYDAALEAFHTLTTNFPNSPKVPDGLLKVGMAQVEKKQLPEAKATLQKVVSDYPNTNAASLARQRLDQLK